MDFKSKVSAIYSIFSKIVKKPKSIFLVLKDESEHEKYLQKKYGINQLKTVDLNGFLFNNKAEIDHYTFLSGTSFVTDLALLNSIAQSLTNCQYLEIGTWRGESIMNVAQYAAHCTSINLSPEEIIELGLPKKYAQLHGCMIKNQKNVLCIQANSLNFDFSTLNKKFDFIFVDGDHSYRAVKSDTKNVYQLLKDENSIIVWHDYGFDPETPRHSVISGILDGMPTEAHQYLYHVSNTICAIYTKRKLESNNQESPVKPDKIFRISIENRSFEV